MSLDQKYKPPSHADDVAAVTETYLAIFQYNMDMAALLKPFCAGGDRANNITPRPTRNPTKSSRCKINITVVLQKKLFLISAAPGHVVWAQERGTLT